MNSTLVLLFVCLFGASQCWINDWDEPFSFTCPAGRFISVFQSDHEDHYEDRRFDFQCSDLIGEPEQCIWTEYLNDYDEAFTHPCPNTFYIGGIESVHDGHYEDRIFQVQCCSIANFNPVACQWTNYVNAYDEDFTFAVSDSQVMCGLGSEHDDHYEDRRFEFYLCDKP